jgi:hypothetical protein
VTSSALFSGAQVSGAEYCPVACAVGGKLIPAGPPAGAVVAAQAQPAFRDCEAKAKSIFLGQDGSAAAGWLAAPFDSPGWPAIRLIYRNEVKVHVSPQPPGSRRRIY